MLLLFDTVIAVELLLKTNTFDTSTTNQQTTCSHQKKKPPPNHQTNPISLVLIVIYSLISVCVSASNPLEKTK